MTEKSCKAFSERECMISAALTNLQKITTNYYEAGHYRPLLGNKLLERINKSMTAIDKKRRMKRVAGCYLNRKKKNETYI